MLRAKNYICASLLLLMPTLASCNNTQEINQRYHQIKAECLRQPMTRENVIQQETCMDNAFIYASQQMNSPVMWAVDERVSSIHNAAIDYAEGRISRNKLGAEIKSADARYYAAVQQAQQQQNQQDNIQTMQLLQIYQSTQPKYYAPQGTNCSTQYIGNTAQTYCY